MSSIGFARGHTAANTPDLFRTPKLTAAGPGQYWGGGPPGKSFGCCELFLFYAWTANEACSRGPRSIGTVAILAQGTITG